MGATEDAAGGAAGGGSMVVTGGVGYACTGAAPPHAATLPTSAPSGAIAITVNRPSERAVERAAP